MFMREEDFPTCKLGKLGEQIGGGGGILTTSAGKVGWN